MKRLPALASFAALVLMVVAGCSKSSTGPDTSTTSGPLMPLTKGSTWSYTGRDTYTLTSNGDSTINGVTWTVLTHSVNGKVLMRKDSTSYMSIDASGTKVITLLIDGPVGTTWTYDTFNPITFTPYRFADSVVARNQTRTVHGTEFKSVVQVHVIQSTLNSQTNQYSVTGKREQYYAPNVGLVQEDFGTGFGTDDLTTYLIK